MTDLRSAAEDFDSDPTVDYAALRERTKDVLGRAVAFVGYVYHAQKSQHETNIQALVEKCDGDRKCPVWVTYPGDVAVSERSWVDVRGYADGVQKFRTKDGKVDTIPKVRAAFVLPKSQASEEPSKSTPRSKRKRRRATKARGDVVNPWR